MNHSNRFVCAAALSGLAALSLGAQTPQATSFLDVGSERERVLRVLQIVGDVPLYPWSIRQLSPGERDRLQPRAATGLLPVSPQQHIFGALRMEVLPLESNVVFNSAFPYGFNDGPMWAGRGLTGALSGGIAGRIGPVSFQLEPTVFDAQNASYPLAPGTSATRPGAAFSPGVIDLPQRFGTSAYGRFDLGQSTVRVDLGPVVADLSTADQWWGPAITSPLILGNNAPGFLHASLGTSHPVNIGIGQVHGRLVWGRLEQSQYAPAGFDSVRFMAGLVAEFVPKGVSGLEIGFARFFHTPWPSGGLGDAPFSRALEGILKQSLATVDNPTGQDIDNQLASVFARWAFPKSGVEVYAEYGREDHNVDIRDFWQEPDHDAGYTVGLQRAWRHTPSTLFVVRGEVLDTRLSALNQGRPQAPWYIHSILTQGHTERGQVLGAFGGFGGSAATLAFDSYSASGRWTLSWDRTARAERQMDDGTPIPAGADILHAFGFEREMRRGATSYTLGARAIWDLNRDFVSDRFNLNLTAGVRRAW